MGDYFDAFRIDYPWLLPFEHPMHEIEGIMGNFDPAIPVHIRIQGKRIWFDFDRYTKPFINEPVLGNCLDQTRISSTFFNDLAIGAKQG
jgi:4-alpha-glucanotransferase